MDIWGRRRWGERRGERRRLGSPWSKVKMRRDVEVVTLDVNSRRAVEMRTAGSERGCGAREISFGVPLIRSRRELCWVGGGAPTTGWAGQSIKRWDRLDSRELG